jgi:hypothetical protein
MRETLPAGAATASGVQKTRRPLTLIDLKDSYDLGVPLIVSIQNLENERNLGSPRC